MAVLLICITVTRGNGELRSLHVTDRGMDNGFVECSGELWEVLRLRRGLDRWVGVERGYGGDMEGKGGEGRG